MQGSPKKKAQPKQQIDDKEGMEEQMDPKPVYKKDKTSERLKDKVAIITGGDSGIGRAVSIAFAQEGADVVIAFNEDEKDADITAKEITALGRKCLLHKGDVGDQKVCADIIKKAIGEFGKLDILVNNAAVQFPQKELKDITPEQLLKTFSTNIFSQFYMVQAAEPHLKKGAAIINTTSVTAYRGSPELLDYSSTKGAIVAFTRSLSGYFAKKGIRVNGVAPGPIWTPLIPSTFPPDKVAEFGTDTPLGRVGQPVEVAGAYVFLASDDGSYMSGQVIHPNGGEIING